MEIRANIILRKLVVTKENENFQPGYAELKTKGGKYNNV
jgi:hypothetical protein